jgi:hypothetical protein
MLLLLIALAVCALGSPKPPVQRDLAPNQPIVQFGQSLAVPDFDQDGTIDRARLSGTGLRKNVELFLSASDGSSEETADQAETVSDQIVTTVCSTAPDQTVLISHQSFASVSSGADQRPSQRGPPSHPI